MVLTALSRAWGDLFRPRIFGVVLLGVLLTLVLFTVLQAAAFWAIRIFAPETMTLPWIGEVSLAPALSWGSLILFPIMSIFLMAPVTAGFAGLFAERVAEAVEEIHYPGAKGLPVEFMAGLMESLAVMGAVIGVALVSLLLTPFLGPLASVLFYLGNGWLLGREFFQMAARRHLHAPQATALRQSLATRTTLLGVLIALLLTVPFLNVLVPVLAAAGFTHLFHLARR
ncbi:MAG TPA: EI24 domain-containing protein [Paracoccus sp. (in: a-proteobacteria)]|uniref:EI24 domain-containing protein n=1 Tax=Paracoccus sp. TaxID=267 RepID=UPI002B6460EA|nr:EI24 domain-containing protein [Paracoccus sp. (in: a-proteobacteria)]HWL56170.1 EI24 domain-containing protein [Paracoccus sp. (in: a-proteobacteria)]